MVVFGCEEPEAVGIENVLAHPGDGWRRGTLDVLIEQGHIGPIEHGELDGWIELVYDAARGLGELAVHATLAKRTCDGDDVHFNSLRSDALDMWHGIATYRMPQIDAE